MLNIKSKNNLKRKENINMKLSTENTRCTLCFSTDVFNAITMTNLSIKREYSHCDIQIIRNIVIVSVCGEVKFAFEAKKLQPFGDCTVILGNDQHLLVHTPRKNFKEEFIFGN